MFPVEPDNWEIVGLFSALRTQWRVAPMGGYLGLDYTAVAAVFNILRVADRETVFSHLQEMESAALQVFSTRSKA